MLATGLIADAPSFIDHMFSAFKTPAIDNFVCETMRDSCPDIWAVNNLNNLTECEAKLKALPLSEGDDFYIDGNTCASPRAALKSLQPLYSYSRPHALDVPRGARAQAIVPQVACGLRRNKRQALRAHLL